MKLFLYISESSRVYIIYSMFTQYGNADMNLCFSAHQKQFSLHITEFPQDGPLCILHSSFKNSGNCMPGSSDDFEVASLNNMMW